ncbi:hypothetical protein MKZ38_009557 [Zalerion maritima]|uniref:Uncharacterized protein n=1 Tax=Zalerion maritima TaxID=339359 RepID=A0AAD5RT43_9PEZI|nr:hypothetical protein MKZ38_009557 [Zalerion maritima]
MASCLLASLAFGRIIASSSSFNSNSDSNLRSSSHEATTPDKILHQAYAIVLLALLLASPIALFLMPFASSSSASPTSVFWLSGLFVMVVGVCFPCAGTLKGEPIGDTVRARVYSAMRIPLNVLVVGSLILTKEAEEGGNDGGGNSFSISGPSVFLSHGDQHDAPSNTNPRLSFVPLLASLATAYTYGGTDCQFSFEKWISPNVLNHDHDYPLCLTMLRWCVDQGCSYPVSVPAIRYFDASVEGLDPEERVVGAMIPLETPVEIAWTGASATYPLIITWVFGGGDTLWQEVDPALAVLGPFTWDKGKL